MFLHIYIMVNIKTVIL